MRGNYVLIVGVYMAMVEYRELCIIGKTLKESLLPSQLDKFGVI